MAKILLIEDEAPLRGLLKELLQFMGHEVVVAENGEKGLAKQLEVEADLVLTDLIMPGKEGLETIRELKAGWPNLKIIAMSGGGRASGADYLELAHELGAEQVLAKPFSRQELADALALLKLT